jgi:hypothetical protein
MKFKVGDIVHLVADAGFSERYRSMTYRIQGVPAGARGVNYTAKPVDAKDVPLTSERGVRAPERCFDFGRAKAYDYASAITMIDSLLKPGTLVSMARRPGLFVVTGTTAKGHRIFPLGGSDRYLTNVPRSSLTVLEVVHAEGSLLITIRPEGKL